MRCKLTVVNSKIRSLINMEPLLKRMGNLSTWLDYSWTDLLLGPLESSHGVSVRCG